MQASLWQLLISVISVKYDPLSDSVERCKLHKFFYCSILFCSLAILDPRVGHTIYVVPPFISILYHSDWLFLREFCPRLDVVEYMAGHVVNPSTKFELWRSYGYPFLSYESDISHRIPLTMNAFTATAHAPYHVTCVLFIAYGQIFPRYLKSMTPISLFTMQLLWRYD